MKRSMMTLGFATILLAGVPAFAADAPSSATATPAASMATSNGAASAVIKGFYGKLSSSMMQGEQASFAERVKTLTPAVEQAYNMPEMTRLSVGSVWSSASPAEQKQLIDAFAAFSAANYARNFAKDDGTQLAVIDEKPASGGVMVDTKIEPKSGDAVPINYLMKKDEKGQWKIVDVFLNGSISELSNRRADFSGIAQRDGIPALINNLDEKSKSMAPG